MPAQPIRLTPELIARFETALISVAPGYRDALRPGLSRDEIVAITEGLPGELPEEAVNWWEWRNGLPDYAPHERPGSVPIKLGRGEYRLSSLETSVSLYSSMRRPEPGVENADMDAFAPPQLFPIELSGELSIELSTPAAEISPVFYTGPDLEFGLTAARSFGEVILWWTESLENGSLEWNRENGWSVNEETIRPELLKWCVT